MGSSSAASQDTYHKSALKQGVISALARAGFPRALGGLQSFPRIPGSSGDAERLQRLCSKGSSPATAAGTEPAKLSPFLDPARKAL